MDKLGDVIYYLADKLGRIESRTKLVKLLFLIDTESKKEINKTLTGINYIYHFYGPYSEDIIHKAIEMDGEEVREVYNPILERYEYHKGEKERDLSFDEKELEILENVLEKYGTKSTQEIKNIVYSTDEVKGKRPGEIILT
ncbi:MAG: Panacea domain-containing protein [Archaeoglobaceae archaeon]